MEGPNEVLEFGFRQVVHHPVRPVMVDRDPIASPCDASNPRREPINAHLRSGVLQNVVSVKNRIVEHFPLPPCVHTKDTPNIQRRKSEAREGYQEELNESSTGGEG